MTWFRRSGRAPVIVSAMLLVAAASCASAPPPVPPVPPPPAAPTPFTEYTLDPPVHRNPVTIAWHAASESFFVGTYNDGTIYRGRPDDPTVRVFLEGRRGQAAHGIDTDEQRMYVAGGMYGDIRIVDVNSRASLGSFDTGTGGWLVDVVRAPAGDLWVTDAARPVLWHVTAELLAAGTGMPAAIPLTPEIPYVSTPDNVYGIVALSDRRLVVVKHTDGTLYRIELDPQAPSGRTITQIDGVTVPLGEDMILEGRRLLVADDAGVSVVELSEDALHGTLVTQVRDPSFRDAASVAHVGDRLLVVNAGWSDPIPDTITSVPAT